MRKISDNIFCRTVGLDSQNYVRLAEDIRKWISNSTVYVQSNPVRLVVCYSDICTVINEGNIFSFVQRATDGKLCIVNHSEKNDTVRVRIGDNEFIVELFVYDRIGDTQNHKFRLTCVNSPEKSEVFDDFYGVKERLSDFLREDVYRRLLDL